MGFIVLSEVVEAAADGDPAAAVPEVGESWPCLSLLFAPALAAGPTPLEVAVVEVELAEFRAASGGVRVAVEELFCWVVRELFEERRVEDSRRRKREEVLLEDIEIQFVSRVLVSGQQRLNLNRPGG